MKKALLLVFVLLSLFAFSQTKYYPYSDGSKWGVTNEKVEVVIKPQFDTSFWFNANSMAPVSKNGKWGAVDNTGKTVVPCVYEKIELADKLAFGMINKKYAIISLKTGKQVMPQTFDQINYICHDCTEGIVSVYLDKKYGFVNTASGKIIGKIMYAETHFLNEFPNRGVIAVTENNNTRSAKYGVMDLKTGNVIIQPEYTRIKSEEKNGQMLIRANNPNGELSWFDSNGKKVDLEKMKKPAETASLVADEAVFVREESVKDDGEDAFLPDLFIYNQGDGNWKVTVEKRFSDKTTILKTYEINGYTRLKKLYFDHFDQNKPARILAVKDGKAGIIDQSGNVLIPFQYDDIDFTDMFYATKFNNKIGLLDLQLKELKKPVLKRIIGQDYRVNGLFIEMPGGQKGFIDRKTGQIYIPGIVE